MHDTDLSANGINGSLPSSLGNFSKLFWLDLSNNSITGSIPESIGLLTNLDTLYLAGNNLTGSLPASISLLTNLYALDLRRNNLLGPLPPFAFNWSMSALSLSDNHFEGQLPAYLGDFTAEIKVDSTLTCPADSTPCSAQLKTLAARAYPNAFCRIICPSFCQTCVAPPPDNTGGDSGGGTGGGGLGGGGLGGGGLGGGGLGGGGLGGGSGGMLGGSSVGGLESTIGLVGRSRLGSSFGLLSSRGMVKGRKRLL
ncbi:unnamed protein product [Closterium sp. Yama58-4]|nr:unnamed protein product [Closterium sp. Yama58-4]